MPRLVVHVGPPKTATTYIQQALLANESALAAHGVYLPKAGRSAMSGKAVAHHHLAWELTGSPRYEPGSGWGALAQELRGVDAETVLISSELLAPSIFTHGIEAALDHRLLSLGRDVSIVYVVRDQLSLINSTYAQQVKLLMEVGDFKPYVAGVLKRGDADLERQTARWWRSSDIELVAVPFPVIAQSPLTALLCAARIDVPDAILVSGPAAVNITLGPIAIEALRLLRGYLRALHRSLSDDDMAVRRLHRIAARATVEAGWCDEPFWGWPAPLAREAASRMLPSNERFARAVWGSPWSMPLPLEQEQRRANLLSLPPDDLDRVQDFVHAMGQRYVTLRRGGARR